MAIGICRDYGSWHILNCLVGWSLGISAVLKHLFHGAAPDQERPDAETRLGGQGLLLFRCFIFRSRRCDLPALTPQLFMKRVTLIK